MKLKLRFPKKIASLAALLLGANLLTTFLTLLAGLYLARQLTTVQYGQYAYMASLFMLISLFGGLGLTGQVCKDTAELNGPARQQQLGQLLGLRLSSTGVVGVLGLLATLVSADVTYLYAAAGAGLFIYADFIVGAFSGLSQIKPIAFLICVQPTTFVGLVWVMPINSVFTIYNIFLLSQLTNVVLASGLAWQRRELRTRPDFWAIKKLNWRTMVAGQIYGAVLLQTAYGFFGVTLLGTLGHYAEAGEISIALTLVRMLPLFTGTIVSNLYYPRMCAIFSQGDRQQLKATANQVYQLSALVAIGCTSLLIVYSDTIVTVLYTERHAGAAGWMRLLACLTFFTVVDQVLTWTMIASGRAKQALGPLAVRMALLLAAFPLTLFASGEGVVLVVVLAYPVSAAIGWLLQLYYSGQTNILATGVFTGLLFGLGFAVGLLTRALLVWSNSSFVAVGGLVFAALVYCVAGLGLWWFLTNRQALKLIKRT